MHQLLAPAQAVENIGYKILSYDFSQATGPRATKQCQVEKFFFFVFFFSMYADYFLLRVLTVNRGNESDFPP